MNIGTKTIKNLGRVTIKREWIYDESPDISDLGEYTRRREPATAEQKLVHRDSGRVLDHHGIWRDAKGHIQADPIESGEYSEDYREFGYTFHDNGHDKIAYALADSKRMDAMNKGDWFMAGCRVRVLFDGAEIGESALWGIESDSGRGYFREVFRDVAAEALREAKEWKRRNLAA